MKSKTLINSSLILGALTLTSQAALVADAAADFIAGTSVGDTTTATGWEYVTATTATGTGTDLVWDAQVGNVANTEGFGGGPTSGNFDLPAVVGSTTKAQYEIFADGADDNGGATRYDGHGAIVGTDLILHPSSQTGEDFLILRYTLSAADLTNGTDLSVVGSFRDISGLNTLLQANTNQAGSITAQVYFNSSQEFTATGADGTLTQANGTFSFTKSGISAGDTISFVIDMNGNQAGDESALQAQISVVPEPTSIALLGLGTIGFFIRRRR